MKLVMAKAFNSVGEVGRWFFKDEAAAAQAGAELAALLQRDITMQCKELDLPHPSDVTEKGGIAYAQN